MLLFLQTTLPLAMSWFFAGHSFLTHLGMVPTTTFETYIKCNTASAPFSLLHQPKEGQDSTQNPTSANNIMSNS